MFDINTLQQNWDFMPQSFTEYNVNFKTGFLPENQPLTQLPSPYYDPWEQLASKLREYMLAGTFRQQVHNLPTLSIEKLSNLREYQRACVVLTFLAHAYVWGHNQTAEEILPQCLAVPWCEVSNKVGISPILTNSTVVLWNWQHLKKDSDEMSFANLATSFTFTGTLDESWFYLVSAMIESMGGDILQYGGKMIKASTDGDAKAATDGLNDLTGAIKKMIKYLNQMYESNDPYIFYWKIRKYLAGWDNMKDAGLEHGIIYENARVIDSMGNTNPDNSYAKFSGGSAAQSSVIQVLDILLGVKHYHDVTGLDGTETVSGSPSSTANNSENSLNKHISAPGNPYLLEMRKYMTRSHRQFLIDLENVCSFREFVLRNTRDVSVLGKDFQETIDMSSEYLEIQANHSRPPVHEQVALLKAYNNCVSMLKAFRDAHIQIVKVYVVSQARNPNGQALKAPVPKKPSENHNSAETTASNSPVNQTKATNSPIISTEKDSQAINAKLEIISQSKCSQEKTKSSNGLAILVDEDQAVLGTGGTDAIAFLKLLRDETRMSRVR
ncbi:hypothetical protein BB561_000150 [Smittium simulii]|uniref:Indoleamine 2,3-dioxygenase n=1 Tax=Smittium simulii TaxID=133385 RepID=A0A2T9Z0H1_9FUNG|nr:hypothetical protein BB561_000150 [Smittium simulii]